MLTSKSPIVTPKHLRKSYDPDTYKGVCGGKYHLINTLSNWSKFYLEMRKQLVVACDTETSGLSPIVSHIVGFSFSWGAKNSYYIPVRHTRLIANEEDPGTKLKPNWIEIPTDEKQLDIDLILPDLKEFFGNPKVTTIWHHAKFDTQFILKEGINIQCGIQDTLLMSNLLNENSSGKLKDIAVEVVSPAADQWEKQVDDWRSKFARTYKKPKSEVHYGFLPLAIATPYAASDGHYTYAIFKDHLPKLISQPDLKKIYLDIELPLLPVLTDMEQRGAVIDREYLKELGPKLDSEIEDLKKTLQDDLGLPELNVNSGKQLIPALQDIGVTFTKRTPKGAYKLDAGVLEVLATKHKVCNTLQEYRLKSKIKGTYVKNVLDMSRFDQKIHCTYNQNVTTGRLSARQPNVMNIPRSDTTIRRAFVTPKRMECASCGGISEWSNPGPVCPYCSSSDITIDDRYVLVFIDLSQIEIRLTGHMSQDPILLDIYNNTKQDIHLRTCCEMFGYDYDEAKAALEDEEHPLYKQVKEHRQISKMVNFLIIYGGGPKALSVNLSTPGKPISKQTCKKYIDQYLSTYSGVNKWMGKTRFKAGSQQFIQNYFYRYRRLPDLAKLFDSYIDDDERSKVERAKRRAVNFVIQGTAADMFKIIMVRCAKILEGSKSRLVIPIHDEILFYIHKEDFNLLPKLKHAMEDWNFDVPIVAEINFSATSWADKKALM